MPLAVCSHLFSGKNDVKYCRSSSANVCMFSFLQGNKMISINCCFRSIQKELHVSLGLSPLQDGLQAGVVQQQVSHLHYLTTRMAQPLPQIFLQSTGEETRLRQRSFGNESNPQGGYSRFIVKVSLPHRLLQVRHRGLIKRGQPAGEKTRQSQKALTTLRAPGSSAERSPAEEAVGLEAGAGCREDVQEGVDGGGGVTQVANNIRQFLEEKRRVCERLERSSGTSQRSQLSCCCSVETRFLQPQMEDEV